MSWRNRRRRSSDAAEKQSKIRKRGCSSSYLLRESRFKRASQAAERVGSTTPVPTWKVMVSRSPSARFLSSEILNCPLAMEGGGKAKDLSVSARKLAATLWEINEVSTPTEAEAENKLKLREKTAVTSRPELSDPDPFHSTVSERVDRSEGFQEQRRITEDGFDGRHSLMEIPSHSRSGRKCTSGRRSTLKEVRNGLATAKELLKVLNHLSVFEGENPSATASICSALETELNTAKEHVDELLKEQRSNHRETEQLLRCFAEEKAIWVSKEQEKIRNAVQSIAGEVKAEKKMRKQAERLNKKLGRELANSKAALIKAANEAKREKRAKEIFEQICDELARGIGEDRAHVEELKKESVKAREEVEKEREMLQIADVLREERVQMKLSEAKHHFEEKNAAIDKLKTELEAYLKHKSSRENDDESPKVKRIKELEAYLKEINFGSSQIEENDDDQGQVEDGEENEEEEEEEDSADSDLHSIELNMDNNNKSYKWSFANQETAQSDSKRNSVEKEVKGRKSFSEKIQWGSICFNRGASTGKNGDSGSKSQGNSERFDTRKFSDLIQIQPKENDCEFQKQKPVTTQKDYIFSSAKVAPAHSFGYPTPQRSQSYPFC